MNVIAAASHEPSHALRIGSRVGRGEVLECVSHGPTGHVYRVHDLEDGQVIAVREYFPRRIAMRSGRAVLPLPGGEAAFDAGLRAFMKDARRLSSQDHPSLLKVLDVWSEHGSAYLATPWYRGHTVEDLVRSAAEPIAPQLLAVWLRSLADALLPFHRGGSVHGHIHPAQVLVLDTGRPLLLGFSSARAAIAKLLPSWSEALDHPYAAIEAAGGDDLPGPWTDVYSLAALSFLAVTGDAPLGPPERTPVDRQQPLSLRTGGPYGYALLRAIDRGLALSAHARPQTLAQFLVTAGLPERRARPRRAGETLLLNLPAPHADTFEDTSPSVIRLPPTSARFPETFKRDPSPSPAETLARATALAVGPRSATAKFRVGAVGAVVPPAPRDGSDRFTADAYLDASMETIDTHVAVSAPNAKAVETGSGGMAKPAAPNAAQSVSRLWPSDFGGMDAQSVAAGGRTPNGSTRAQGGARPLLLAGLCAGAVIASLAALCWAVSAADDGRRPGLARGAGSTSPGLAATPTTPATTSGEARTGP